MKQFQKYGVAAAVASVATGVVATEVSKKEAGDLAIVPYYTVMDGQNTGIHIINTTDHTQVVKVRLRRATDSKDALDFNLVMSPYDEWTANIGAGGETGVQVTTGDSTCTVPEFPGGVAQMPSTWADGATEGYVEIIAMAQTYQDFPKKDGHESQAIATAAKHKDGTPSSCALVREHFYRVAGASAGTRTVAGVHASDLASNGLCSATAVVTTASACFYTGAALGAAGSANATGIADALDLAVFEDSDDQALKVSWMITDSDGGLEVGDNAVMVEGFASHAMMTNQQPLSFGTDGVLNYDPLNFELPNLAHGAWPSSVGLRQTGYTTANYPNGAAKATSELGDGSMFVDLRYALNADALVNDWASFEKDDGSVVATDWVVTLPGQYTMNNPICDFYGNYTNAVSTAMICNATALAAEVTMSDDELPLYLANGSSVYLTLWDREEDNQAPPAVTENPDLGFSPSGEGDTPAGKLYIEHEVNVMSFKERSVLSSRSIAEDDGVGFSVGATAEADKGWGRLQIVPVNTAPSLWFPDNTALADDGNVPVRTAGDTGVWGGFVDMLGGSKDRTIAIGFAAWERSFADQAGNYGRAIEHTTQGARS